MHLVLLSPHRDDAAFSCGLLAARLLRAGASIQVVNVCTESDYAPYLPADDEPRTAQVTHARLREDRLFLERLQAGVESGQCSMTDLGWLDSPLRLGIATDRVLQASSAPEDEVQQLAHAFARWQAADAVLAPLALGNHIDHRLVRDAACRAFSPAQLGFYEDLPYGCWMPPAERAATVQVLVRQVARGPLSAWQAVSLPGELSPSTTGMKRHFALCYATQIAEELADAMEVDAAQHGGGECMHLPPGVADGFAAAFATAPRVPATGAAPSR